MLELSFTPFPVLTTPRLTLRELSKSDSAEIFFLRSDPAVLRYVDRKTALSIDEARRYIDFIHDLRKKNEVILWGITLHPDDEVIGYVCYWRIDKENYRAEVGYVLHPHFQQKGIMAEALSAVLDYGFTTMRLHTVTANVNPANVPSIQLLKSLKFEQEGYFKQSYYFNGKFLDSIIFTCFNPGV